MKKKSILSKLSLSILGVSATAGMILSSASGLLSNSNSINLQFSKMNTIATTTGNNNTTTSGLEEEDISFTVNTDVNWKGKYFANEITNKMIEEMLVPNKEYGANFYVKILPINNDMLLNGYVNFIVKQIKYDYGNDASSSTGTGSTSPTKEVLIPPPTTPNQSPSFSLDNSSSGNQQVDGENIDNSKIWTTKNVNELIKKRKYSFKWNNDKEIGEFLETTKKSTLTSEEIMNNFVSSSDATDILPEGTKATFSQSFNSTSTPTNVNGDVISEADAKTFGIGEIKIDFYPTDSIAPSSKLTSTNTKQTNHDNEWASGNVPTNNTRIVRGLQTESNGKHVVNLNVWDSNFINNFLETQLDVKKIKAQNPNFNPINLGSSSSNSISIEQLTPTELVNALNGDIEGLLTTSNYLYDTNGATGSTKLTPKKPPIHIKYMNKTAYEEGDIPFKGTGLSTQTQVPYVNIDPNTSEYVPIINNGTPSTSGNNSVNNLMKITNIEAAANDETGTLDLVIYYVYYDVYYNVLVNNYSTHYKIEGLSTNKTSHKNLYFNWKNVDDIPYSSNKELLERFKTFNNESDTNRKKSLMNELANSLFYGTFDTYNLNKEITISESIPSQSNSVDVEITFPEFGGATYEESGQIKKGMKTKKTFTFTSSASSNVVFNSQKSVEQSISSKLGPISNLTPGDVIDAISKGQINENIFISSFKSQRSESNVLFSTNTTNDGINVQVITENKISSNFYTGFKQGKSEDYTYSFGFESPTYIKDDGNDEGEGNDEKKPSLMEIPLQDITPKIVIDLYLDYLPIFKKDSGSPFKISESDVSLEKNYELGSLKITVKVNGYNALEGERNQFTSTVYGFTNQKLVDNNSYVEPLNLTLPLSIAFASLISISFTVVLFMILRKRSKYKKIIKEDKHGAQHN